LKLLSVLGFSGFWNGNDLKIAKNCLVLKY
jgi:hypothetical protein